MSKRLVHWLYKQHGDFFNFVTGSSTQNLQIIDFYPQHTNKPLSYIEIYLNWVKATCFLAIARAVDEIQTKMAETLFLLEAARLLSWTI